MASDCGASRGRVFNSRPRTWRGWRAVAATISLAYLERLAGLVATGPAPAAGAEAEERRLCAATLRRYQEQRPGKVEE
jgi:hypothetical protein